MLSLLVVTLCATGCQAPVGRNSSSAEDTPNASDASEITPASPAYAKWRAKAKPPSGARTDGDVITEGELLQLPKFVVQEKGFVDFGFSIITNEEVLRGKPVKWVQVGVVLPGSLAERCQLTTGMKIVAIDNEPVTNLYREDLLYLLFERERGESVRLLVLSRKLGLLPIFLDLTSTPVAAE